MATADKILLPARLRHSRDGALVRQLAQADAAEPELLVDRARAAAAVAAAVAAHLVLRLPLLLDDERLLGHASGIPSRSGERQAEGGEERVPLLVRVRGRGDRDVEATDGRNLVVVDLREDDLLADADRVVAAPVERGRIEAPEVADAGKRDGREPVEELVHPRAPQGHACAHGHSLAKLEARDRLRRSAYLRPLARDHGQLVDGGVERLRVRLRLADAHVQRDLGHPRDLHGRGHAEVVLEPRPDLVLVAFLEARNVRLRSRGEGAHRSISWPQPSRLQTRTRTISPLTSLSAMPTRVAFPHTGHTTITFDTETGAGFSRIPPGTTCAPPIREESRIGFGRVCRLATLRFSTITRRSAGRASITRPRFPRSLPVRICTVSPFFTFIFAAISEHLGSQADDLHEVLLAELARDGPEDARPARVRLLVDEDGGVLVEADERAVVPAEGLLRTDDHRTHDLALLHRALRRGGLHGSNDHVAHPRVAPVRSAEH